MTCDSGVYGGVCCCDDHPGKWVSDFGGCRGRSGVTRVSDRWPG